MNDYSYLVDKKVIEDQVRQKFLKLMVGRDTLEVEQYMTSGKYLDDMEDIIRQSVQYYKELADALVPDKASEERLLKLFKGDKEKVNSVMSLYKEKPSDQLKKELVSFQKMIEKVATADARELEQMNNSLSNWIHVVDKNTVCLDLDKHSLTINVKDMIRIGKEEKDTGVIESKVVKALEDLNSVRRMLKVAYKFLPNKTENKETNADYKDIYARLVNYIKQEYGSSAVSAGPRAGVQMDEETRAIIDRVNGLSAKPQVKDFEEMTAKDIRDTLLDRGRKQEGARAGSNFNKPSQEKFYAIKPENVMDSNLEDIVNNFDLIEFFTAEKILEKIGKDIETYSIKNIIVLARFVTELLEKDLVYTLFEKLVAIEKKILDMLNNGRFSLVNAVKVLKALSTDPAIDPEEQLYQMLESAGISEEELDQAGRQILENSFIPQPVVGEQAKMPPEEERAAILSELRQVWDYEKDIKDITDKYKLSLRDTDVFGKASTLGQELGALIGRKLNEYIAGASGVTHGQST